MDHIRIFVASHAPNDDTNAGYSPNGTENWVSRQDCEKDQKTPADSQVITHVRSSLGTTYLSGVSADWATGFPV